MDLKDKKNFVRDSQQAFVKSVNSNLIDKENTTLFSLYKQSLASAIDCLKNPELSFKES
jgi:hemerythrin-like domain-containing protein